MVKFFENTFQYDYAFPAVSLAYFLRYPNPYATHVLSTDVIDRHFDPATQRLTTTRLHLKRSKIPSTLLKVLPKGILGVGADSGQSYILETSTVDPREGWMSAESRNLEWTGILSVVEKHLYEKSTVISESGESPSTGSNLVEDRRNESTNATVTVTLLSRFGQAKKLKRQGEAIPGSSQDEEAPAKKGFFSTWSTASLQRSIEAMGLRRTREALGKSKEGMDVVLERLRSGGLKRVLEGMQQDRQRAFGQDGVWKQTWRHGQEPNE